jgi:hypothetical protein
MGFGHIFAGRLGADYDLDPKTRIGGQVRYQEIAGDQPGRGVSRRSTIR